MALKLSPRYPNVSLEEAVRFVGTIYKADMCHPVDREVAAKHMGFTSLNGSSDRVLSALVHYGLLERVGKGEVKVSAIAVDVLHPDKPGDRIKALRQAATTPSLFRDLHARYGAATPSEETLGSYLSRQGFLPSAVPAVVKSYLDSLRYLEQMGASESGSPAPVEPLVSEREAAPREVRPMEAMQVDGHRQAPLPHIVEAALNDIRTEIGGGLVRISATLDKTGLAKLKRKIDALAVLIEDDEDEAAD